MEQLQDVLAMYEKMKHLGEKRCNSMEWLWQKKPLIVAIVNELKARGEEIDIPALVRTLHAVAYQEGVREKKVMELKDGRKKAVYFNIQISVPMVKQFLKAQGLIE